MLSGFVEFDGYYLESDPCLVCNNPEVPFQVSGKSLTILNYRFVEQSFQCVIPEINYSSTMFLFLCSDYHNMVLQVVLCVALVAEVIWI